MYRSSTSMLFVFMSNDKESLHGLHSVVRSAFSACGSPLPEGALLVLLVSHVVNVFRGTNNLCRHILDFGYVGHILDIF